jgi:hypothetical protein
MRVLAAGGLMLLAACAGGGSGDGGEGRYAAAKHPEPTRSASDGEVLGANQQAPADTLEGSVTTAHSAPGWTVENGIPVPKSEIQNRSDASDCEPAGAPNPGATESGSAAAGGSAKKKKPICPPAASH